MFAYMAHVPLCLFNKNSSDDVINNTVLPDLTNEFRQRRKARNSGEPDDMLHYNQLRRETKILIALKKETQLTNFGIWLHNPKRFWSLVKQSTTKNSLVPARWTENYNRYCGPSQPS